jgi:hypothetical protein
MPILRSSGQFAACGTNQPPVPAPDLAEVYVLLLQAQTVGLPRQSYTIDALLPQAECKEIRARK